MTGSGIRVAESAWLIVWYPSYVITMVLCLSGTPSGPKYLQHFAPCNFSSRVNPKTRKNHIGPFCIVLVYFHIYNECLIVM